MDLKFLISLLRNRRNFKSATLAPAFAAMEKGKPLEELHILLVLQECAVERRDELGGIALAQGFGRDAVDEQQLDPVEQFRGRGLLLQARHLAHLVEEGERVAQQILLQARIMHVYDARHGVAIGKADVVEETAAQEG